MSYLAVLVPVALAMGVVGLIAFLWSLQNGQYDDLDGAAERVLYEEDDYETEQDGLTADRTATPNENAGTHGDLQ